MARQYDSTFGDKRHIVEAPKRHPMFVKMAMAELHDMKCRVVSRRIVHRFKDAADRFAANPANRAVLSALAKKEA